MAMWCETCEDFVSELDGFICGICGDGLLQSMHAPKHRPCVVCPDGGEAMANADICGNCDEEIKSGSYNFAELLELFPELCAECFVRQGDETTGMCNICYAEVCWGGTLSEDTRSLKEYYPSRGGSNFDIGGYDWWSNEEETVIPGVEEVQSIPAMRVAA